MLPTPSTTTTSSTTAPSLGINARVTSVLPKSAVRLSMLPTGSAGITPPTTTTAATPADIVKATNSSIDDSLNAQPTTTADASTVSAPKSYAAVTSPQSAQTQQQQQQQQQQQPQPQPQPVQKDSFAAASAIVPTKMDVDPTRNVQHYLQRDRNEFEPFATVCILAIRCVVPGAKLAVNPPLLGLDRSNALIRSVFSIMWSGHSQDVIHQLFKPLKRATELYLREETLHIFQLAEAGLKSLQEIYKNSNADLALQQMINLLQDSYAEGVQLPTGPCITLPDEPFAGLWHASEIASVASFFRTVNVIGLENKEKAAIWTAVIENLLHLKLAVYM